MDKHLMKGSVMRTARMKQLNRIICLLTALLMAVLLAVPAAVLAEDGETEKVTVRVGWHEVPYFIKDESGRCSGYTYDYQCKLAAYTGWDYEYVEGTYSELLQKLMDGEIDMLGNVSYLDERAEKVLYSSVPMGTETYYLFVAPDNSEIKTDDYSTLNGKKIGVAKGTFQKNEFLKWAETHDVEAELVETTATEEESLAKLGEDYDAFVTMDVYADPKTAVPIIKVGSSDFFFALSKDREDLLPELDEAMSRIQEENMYFSQQLHEKYLRSINADAYLSPDELDWLGRHGKIRVGYQDNYLAFCAKDPATGKLTGALKDYLRYASSSMENADLEFEATAFPTAAGAMEALEKGEIDCVFPANLTYYDSEELGVVTTPALMRTEMDAVVRDSEQKEFLKKDDVIVAVNEGNTNYDLWLAENFPTWKRVYFKDTPACLEAIAAGEADCVIISSYRYNNISKQCEKLHLTTLYTGVDMDYCFAVEKGQTELYSILSRVANAVPDTPIHTALTYYSTEDVKADVMDVIRDNLLTIVLAAALIVLVFIMLGMRSAMLHRRVIEEEQVIDDLGKKVYVDALTSVRNKGAFDNYVAGLQEQLDRGEVTAFAIGMLDCDGLKEVNDSFGHDKGDEYLKASAHLICEVFRHSPVFRIGGDEFAAVLINEDYENRDALASEFERESRLICREAKERWQEIRISLGLAVYDPETDQNVEDTVRRADQIMYEKKRKLRAER